MTNPALEALVERKIEEVNAGLRAEYGPALDEWLWSGKFDPILTEIGYNGSELAPFSDGLFKFIPAAD